MAAAVLAISAATGTPSSSISASPSGSPAAGADGTLPTGPGIAIAVVLIGLMLWLRSRIERR